jgi:hypothetical protein
VITQTLRLYECVDALETVLDWIAENEEAVKAAGGELPPELESLLNEVEGNFQEKVERTALVIRNQMANALAAQSEADRLRKIAATYTNQADTLKTYLHAQLQRVGATRIQTARAKVWTQTNGRPSIRLADPEVIPEEFRRVRVEFDGQAAYESLKDAGLIPTPEEGAVEINGLVVERGTHLRIN